MTSRHDDTDPAIIGHMEAERIEPGEMWDEAADVPDEDQQETFIEGSVPRVFVTNPDAPGSGRVFVWAYTRWYEREVGATGAVAFTPISDSEEDLREMVNQVPGADMTELDNDFAERVREEFTEQTPLPVFPEPAETTYRLE